MTVEQCGVQLKEVLINLCRTNNVPLVDEFKMCGRLKTTAGLYKVHPDKYPNGCLTVSKKYFAQNGYQACEAVLRHEFTHHYLFHINAHIKNFKMRWARVGHTHEFKKLCVAFGGTMNSQLAGEEFAQAACTDFVKSAYKWKYLCDCGSELRKTKRKLSQRELNKYRCSHCKTSMNDNMRKAI